MPLLLAAEKVQETTVSQAAAVQDTHIRNTATAL
jgi:hypothetical protein